MKNSIFLIILLALTVLGCGQHGSKSTSVKTDTITGTNNDREQIENLVKQVLKWHDNNGTYTGFEPNFNPNDSMVTGMNLDTLKKELNRLKESNLFDKEFIDNYNTIVLTIDRKIKNKEIEWMDGDMPPYAGADPWCDCQDIPYDNPWDQIEFNFLSLDNENAVLTWTWGHSDWSKDFNYKVKAKKSGDTWKISYLQGFDINDFIK